MLASSIYGIVEGLYFWESVLVLSPGLICCFLLMWDYCKVAYEQSEVNLVQFSNAKLI